MSQVGSNAGMRRTASAAMNVYTVLALIAFLALVVGIAAVWYQNKELFGSNNPFEIQSDKTARLIIAHRELA